jgi:TolB protein
VTRIRILLLALAIPATAALAPTALAASDRAEVQNTILISKSLSGGIPNGPSTHAVISNDRRWARVIAFESEASDLVAGDTNGVKDIFVVRRAGVFGNDGTQWFPGGTRRVSRPRNGGQADGPSWGAAVDGAFKKRPRCVAFLSAASNLVPGDTNGKVDAFVVRLNGRKIRRVSLPRNRQAATDTTSVAVSGNCTRISFSTGGVVYTRVKRRTKKIGGGVDPAYSTGLRNDLVYAGASGVYLSRNGTKRGKLVAPGGRNPAYNDIKRQVVAYEKFVGGHWQVMWRDLGRGERPASSRRGNLGNGDSRHPVIGNSGYYISFESDATNLGTNANSVIGDFNRRTDAYLYTNVRDITLVQSVFEKAVPLAGGGYNPSMAFYANYILFDSPAPMGSVNGAHQVYMRYLGPV